MNAPATNQAYPLIIRVTLPAHLMAFADSFEHLPYDPWCNQRNRQFSQYRGGAEQGDWQFDRLPHRPHIQHPDNNQSIGGILRNLEPLDINADSVLEYTANAFQLNPQQQWHFDLHQWRMNCAANTIVDCVPEGPHQDGHQFVGIFVIKRHAVSGGITTVYNDTGQSVTKKVIAAGEGILLDDQYYSHSTSEISAASEDGYRDIFVVCINHWEAKKYGEEFERSCMLE